MEYSDVYDLLGKTRNIKELVDLIQLRWPHLGRVEITTHHSEGKVYLDAVNTQNNGVWRFDELTHVLEA